MHAFEQIRKEIDIIDGGTFQILAQRCCFRKYGFKSAHYYGTREGSIKTIKGHPDSFYETNTGGWAFLEAGHIGNRAQAIAKIKDDVRMCLDYENQHPDMGSLDLIICCFSYSRFTPADINLLKEVDPRVILVGPDEIAEMCVTYPWLAYEYLGVEAGSPQICDLEKFISLAEEDTFAPSLKIELVERAQEIEDLLQMLGANQAVCLTGKSGSGKTKLAIEVCLQYSTTEKAEVLAIRPSHKPIYEALERCCSLDTKYLLLLDDANDLADLKLVREYASLHENVKILATTRNYAKQQVVKQLYHLRRFEEYSVSPVANEAIEDVLKTQLGIKNQDYIQQIVSIAHGNMRLAILAGESAKANGFQGITNIHDLLEACYEKKLVEFSANEKTAIAISSILGAHATEDNESLHALELKASIEHAQYLEACKSLHRKELLDMIQNYSAVNFEEQNLRDYFIRLAIVEDGIFKLKDIYTLPGGKKRVVDILNVILNVFYTEHARSDLVDQVLEIWTESADHDRIELIKTFGNLIPFESLAFLSTAIQSTDSNPERYNYLPIGLKQKNHYGFESNILECIAGLLSNYEHWQAASNLVFDLLEKENRYVEDYCHIFDSLLKPNRSFLNASIERERHVFDRLKSLYETTGDTTYAVLLLRYIQNILSDEIEGTELGEGHRVIFYRGILQYTVELSVLRKDCVSTLFNLRRESAFTEMADSIAFGYKGLSLEGAPSLASETCRLILENYRLPEMPASYSCLQTIWDFRRSNEKALSEFGWIDKLFDASPTTRLVSYLKGLTWRLTDSDEELNLELQKHVAPMTESDWISFLAMLQVDQTNNVEFDYHIPKILTWALEYYRGRDSRIQKLLLNALLSLGIGPWYDFDSIFSSLESLYQSEDMRQIIIAKTPPKLTASWLARYDTYALEKTSDCTSFTLNVLNGLSEYGEVVELKSIVRADRAQPGFLGKYCKALAESTIVQPSRLRYFPANLDKDTISSLDISLDHNNNLMQVEEFLCSLLKDSGGYWHGEEICLCVIEKDPPYIRDVLCAWIERDSRAHVSLEPNIGKFFWKIPSPIDALALLPEIQKRMFSDFRLDYYFKKCVLSIVNTGISKGNRADLLEWLSSEATSETPFSEVATDVGASLNYETRTEFCIALCEKNAPMDVFVQAAVAMPFNGMSWSGSEIPVIDRKIEYVSNLAKVLLEQGFPKYCSELQESLRCLRKSKSAVEVREFVSLL